MRGPPDSEVDPLARTEVATETDPRDAAASHSGEARAFLQKRVASFGRFGTIIAASFMGLRLAVNAADPLRASSPLLKSGGMGHLAMVLCFAGMWLFCRGTPRSARSTRLSEYFGMFGIAASTTWMLWDEPLASRPELVALLVLTSIFLARAIYVPGTLWRSFGLTLVAGLPLVPVMVAKYLTEWDPHAFAAAGATAPEMSAERVAVLVSVQIVAFWGVTVAVSSVASSIIYGLREEAVLARRLGQYQLLEKLGEGGMGVVYRARHAMLRRPTAVKLLQPSALGEEALKRFEREVQHTAELTHPNTVTVFDYGRTPDGIFYYAMELLDGATLADIVRRTGPQPIARVVHVLDQAAASLAEAHDQGLVHRDIKPENIMLCDYGGERDVVKVLDFGLVHDIRREGAVAADDVAGTPLYMAPETIDDPGQVGPKTDIYALGAVAYWMLAGRAPFQATSVPALLLAVTTKQVAPLSEHRETEVPGELEALVLECLAKDPAQRPPSAERVRARLAEVRLERSWGPEDAAAWWTEHRELTASEDAASLASAETIAVDMNDRSKSAIRLRI